MTNDNDIIIRFCEVISVEDDSMGLRIKVRIPYEDYNVKDIDDLPYVFPLLPKMVHVNPKVGECVLVILQSIGEGHMNRFFIGPVISQPYFMNYDPYDYSSRSLFKGNKIVKPLPNPKMNPENNGTLPDRDDIALIGRKNTDVILKDNEMRLRCGFKKNADGKVEDSLLYNDKDLSYIQLKYSNMIDDKGKEFNSAVNIVADRINLLSHKSQSTLNLNNSKNLISDEQMAEVIKQTHPLPYGDKLINLLKELIRIFMNHTHSFPMDSPVFTQPDKDILSDDLNSILSNNIRIN